MIEEIDIDDLQKVAKEAVSNQWNKYGNIYRPTGETTQCLPPGYYQVVSNWQDFFLVRQNLELEGIYKVDSSNLQEILGEIKTFWTKGDDFKRYKRSYRRGILLSGPPGTGKTCITKLLIKELIKEGGICLAESVNDPANIKRGIDAVRSVQPETPIVVVMEDLDRCECGSDLLNMLDGITPLHNVVFIATANHPEELDEALRERPGRLDRHFKIGGLNKKCRRQFIQKLLQPEDLKKIDIEKYVEDTEGLPLGHIEDLVISTVVMGNDYDRSLQLLLNLSEGIEDEEATAIRTILSQLEEAHGETE